MSLIPDPRFAAVGLRIVQADDTLPWAERATELGTLYSVQAETGTNGRAATVTLGAFAFDMGRDLWLWLSFRTEPGDADALHATALRPAFFGDTRLVLDAPAIRPIDDVTFALSGRTADGMTLTFVLHDRLAHVEGALPKRITVGVSALVSAPVAGFDGRAVNPAEARARLDAGARPGDVLDLLPAFVLPLDDHGTARVRGTIMDARRVVNFHTGLPVARVRIDTTFGPLDAVGGLGAGAAFSALPASGDPFDAPVELGARRTLEPARLVQRG